MFAYWRRDHRRPTASAAAPPAQSTTQPTNDPPQLPTAVPTSNLTNDIFESRNWTRSDRISHSRNASNTEPSTIASPEVAPPAVGERSPVVYQDLSYNNDNNRNNRNSLVGEDCDSNASFTSGNTQNSPILCRSDQYQYDNGFQKASSSPLRRTLGKNLSPGGLKAEGGNSPGGSGMLKMPPDTYNSDVKTYPYEMKAENVSSRRAGTYEVLEPTASKAPKTRLNLLNPMALLARRRAAQTVNSRPEDINISNLKVPALPDDYDPRIRGKLVHDFSVPRARPTIEKNFTSKNTSLQTRDYTATMEKQFNTPRTTDHRANIHSETYNNQIENRQSIDRERRLEAPGEVPQQERSTSPSTSNQSKTHTSTLRSNPSFSRDPSSTHLGLPRHLTSSASRFSFDMAGGDSSSQEKLMEEKHKEKEAAKKARYGDSGIELDGYSDEFDYDAMMDDDGLEEKIPGINADADSIEDGRDEPYLPQQGWQRPQNTFVPTLPTVLPSPIISGDEDSSTQLSAVAQQASPVEFPSRNATFKYKFDNSPTSPETSRSNADLYPAPLRPLSFQEQNYPTNINLPANPTDEGDGMYFDDGLFGDLPEDMKDSTFDESIFDDETSYLYDRKNRTNKPDPAATEAVSSQHDPPETISDNFQGISLEEGFDEYPQSKSRALDEPYQDSEIADKIVEPKPSVRLPSHGLTEGNLEAYHNALVEAANEAARKGRFKRSDSRSETSADESQTADSYPCLTGSESKYSQAVEATGIDETVDDFEYYDGDALDDDPIIAEANAEVLENDDEGFYGQEFGFYAHSRGNGDTERVYGGYFGSRGVEGLVRHHSGRKNFEEPSLTPITERSEWSTRNSIISLATHGVGPSVSSPALSQLVDMGSLEDEISLSKLLKLRRGAWGGSNGSLRSSAASPTNQSPSSHIPSSNYGSISNLYETESPARPSSLNNTCMSGAHLE